MHSAAPGVEGQHQAATCAQALSLRTSMTVWVCFAPPDSVDASGDQEVGQVGQQHAAEVCACHPQDALVPGQVPLAPR